MGTDAKQDFIADALAITSVEGSHMAEKSVIKSARGASEARARRTDAAVSFRASNAWKIAPF